jgi:hypothetical protein
MSFKAVQNEVDHLHAVSSRLEELADQLPAVSKELFAISRSLRNTAILLAVLVEVRNPKPI